MGAIVSLSENSCARRYVTLSSLAVRAMSGRGPCGQLRGTQRVDRVVRDVQSGLGHASAHALRVAVKLTVREAAAVLNVPETRIYRWVDEEEIPFVMIHQHPRFHRLELLEWAMEMELPIAVDLYEHAHDQPLAHALERGGGRTLAGDLANIAAALPIESAADREVIRAVLAARAGAMFASRATGGIAIPQARSPIITPQAPARAMLWWCEPGALALDDAAVNALFLILAPTVTQHLQLLSRLSLALHDREFCAAVHRRGAFDELLAEARRWEQAIEGGER